jgi:hypothetical protein
VILRWLRELGRRWQLRRLPRWRATDVEARAASARVRIGRNGESAELRTAVADLVQLEMCRAKAAFMRSPGVVELDLTAKPELWHQQLALLEDWSREQPYPFSFFGR